MMKSNIFFLLIITFTFPLDSMADRNKENENLAWVIGNGNYEIDSKKLPNAAKDARDIATILETENMDYFVIETIDAKSSKMLSDFNEFKKLSKTARKIIVFYAGHGVQVRGVNYLQPTNVIDNQSGEKRYTNLKDKWFRMQSILDVASKSKARTIVFLDACRNNPFFISGKKNKFKELINESGLEYRNGRNNNISIYFSTTKGKKSNDGIKGKNSPFAEAIIKYISEGQRVTDFVDNVNEYVESKTKNSVLPQFPKFNQSGNINYCLTRQCFAIIDNAWNNCLKYNNRKCYEYFIDKYKTSERINNAKIKLKKIESEKFYSIMKLNTNIQSSHYKKYINNYPKGLYVKEAQKKIEVLERSYIKISDIYIDNLKYPKESYDIKKLKIYIADSINKLSQSSEEECWDGGISSDQEFCYTNIKSNSLCSEFEFKARLIDASPVHWHYKVIEKSCKY